MELPELLKGRREALDELRTQLSTYDQEVEAVSGAFPPRWSGDVKGLLAFVRDLGEWVRDPKVKRAKEIVGTLRRHADDKRSLQGLGEDYLISILEPLEEGIECLLNVKNRSLRANAAKRMLDEVQNQEEIAGLVHGMKEYC
ncbi:unnamed protein product, partial [marine sediment metagenome]